MSTKSGLNVMLINKLKNFCGNPACMMYTMNVGMAPGGCAQLASRNFLKARSFPGL